MGIKDFSALLGAHKPGDHVKRQIGVGKPAGLDDLEAEAGQVQR